MKTIAEIAAAFGTCLLINPVSLGLMFMACGTTNNYVTSPENTELRLTDCAIFADTHWSSREWEIAHRRELSGLPCGKDLINCPVEEQNARYLELVHVRWLDGWPDGNHLMQYRRCVEREQ